MCATPNTILVHNIYMFLTFRIGNFILISSTTFLRYATTILKASIYMPCTGGCIFYTHKTGYKNSGGEHFDPKGGT